MFSQHFTAKALRTRVRSFSSFAPSMMETFTFVSPFGLKAPLRFIAPLLRRNGRGTSFRNLAKTTAASAKSTPIRPNIAVVGGGHAGLSTALRLSSLPWTRLTKPTITLIDRSDRFVFLPMLYELALSQVNQWEIAPKFSDLLRETDIQFVQGDVQKFDMDKNVVEGLSRSDKDDVEFSVSFDRAVLAIGAEPANILSVPGASEYALPFYRMQDAIELKQRLEELPKGKSPGEVINIVIVGGGFSGIELASCLAERLASAGSVLVVETSDCVLKNAAEFNRRTAVSALVDNGAVVEYNARVTNVSEGFVTISKDGIDGNEASTEMEYPADLVLWTAGSRASSVQSRFGMPLDETGRLVTDNYLQVQGREDHIYALGDASVAGEDTGYYGTAQVAVQQAEYAAWNAWAALTGRKKLKYRYTHLGEMMVLGDYNASLSSPVGLGLGGRAAWISRRLAYLARMPTDRHRRLVAASWATHPLLEGMGNLVKASRQYRTNV